MQKSRTNTPLKHCSGGNKQHAIPITMYHPRSLQACKVWSFQSLWSWIRTEQILFKSHLCFSGKFCTVQEIFNYSHSNNYTPTGNQNINVRYLAESVQVTQVPPRVSVVLDSYSSQLAAPLLRLSAELSQLVLHRQRAEPWFHDFRLQPWNAAIENPELFLPLSSRSISAP